MVYLDRYVMAMSEQAKKKKMKQNSPQKEVFILTFTQFKNTNIHKIYN